MGARMSFLKVILLITLFFVVISTAFAVEAEIYNLDGVCDDSGNIMITGLHRGRPLATREIEIKATHNTTNRSVDVIGYWEVDGMNVSYLMGKISTSSNRFYFYSTNSPMTKDGTYVIRVSFFASAADYSKTNVFFTVNCEGKKCGSDIDCNIDEFCNNDTGRCSPLRCKEDEIISFNRCIPRCNDNNPCTKDTFRNGLCVYTKIKDCCIKNEDCNDGLSCTTERCSNNKCIYEPLKCGSATGSCIVSKCVEPRGCIYETDEACLAEQNQKRQYMIIIGEPKVEKEPMLRRILNWFKSIFNDFF